MPPVRMLPLEQTFDCDEGETVLAAALRQGRYLRYGCKHGGCGTCRALLVDGDVDEAGSTFALPSSDRAEGWVLLCASVPLEPCTIDVSAMELTEEEFLSGDRVGAFTAEVEDVRRLTPEICGLRLRLIDPASMRFVAGQFVNVEVPGTSAVRAFSMANPPSDNGYIDLIVRVLPGGAFSQLVATSLAPGDELRLYGPLGQLKVRLSYRPMVMVAGGSGLAPILSMLADLADRGNARPVTLFFGARSPEGVYYTDRLDALRMRMPCLEVVTALSDAAPPGWRGEAGLVTDVLARVMPRLDGYDAYLCGPPPMIEAAVPLLTALGVRARNVYFDAFVPTG